MQSANADMNIQDISQMIRSFTKESMKAEMNQEMVADAMDMGEVGEEADDVYNQILGEVGLKMEEGATVGTGKIPTKAQPAAQQEEEKAEELDDLEARLAALGQ